MASSAVKSVSRTVKSRRANALRGCQDPDMRRRSCLPACLVLVLMSLASLAQAADRPPGQTAGGTLVILGGAVKDGNDALWQAVVQAAGGPGALVLVLPTASSDPEGAARATLTQLQRRGARVEVLPVAPRWPGSSLAHARQQANDAAWVARMQEAGGVFMTGGEQDRLMDVLRPDGRDTPLLSAMRALLARGGVVAGTSAGAAVMSETAIRGLDDPFDALRRPLSADELGQGFGLLHESVVTDQHFLRRGRVARLVRVLLQSGRALGLGVEEDSAALVRQGVAEAVGARGLLLVDASGARVDASAPLQVRGLCLSYVDRGDRYDLVRRRLLPPATRQLLRPGPEAGAAGFYGDILGDNIVVGAMARAAEGPGRAAVGLAWRQGQGLGFEWRFSTDEHTRAWGGPTRDDHTIDALRLDIRPVRLAQPVYRDWRPDE
ncbi:cyanophycinase [Rubrivivax albus]|uniref:Cyanophycinase n=2 Tax=Rubrivivax albus TaxID=2499835 RepID=A0A3S2VZE2_9BURK|nr:cyanophycinase [Rubrivivax albus]